MNYRTLMVFISFLVLFGFLPSKVNSINPGTFKVNGPQTIGANGPQTFTITIHNALNQVVIYANSELVYSKTTNSDQTLNDKVDIPILSGRNYIEVICIKWGPSWHLNYEINMTGAYGRADIPSPVNDIGRNGVFGVAVSYQYIINRF